MHPRVSFSLGGVLLILLLPILPFTSTTFSAHLLRPCVQGSHIFHLLALVLKIFRSVVSTNRFQSSCCRNGSFSKGTVSCLTKSFLKWDLKRRCQKAISIIAPGIAFCRSTVDRLPGYPKKLSRIEQISPFRFCCRLYYCFSMCLFYLGWTLEVLHASVSRTHIC